MIKQVNINEVLTNPNNPRTIKDDKFKKLVKSIKEFPQMLEKRAIVVDEAMMVLGGNMRLKACKDAGVKMVWVDVAEGWTEQQKKEFIVKDNVGFGEWDWDAIANEWEDEPLNDWGLDVWKSDTDLEDFFEQSNEQENINAELQSIVLNYTQDDYDLIIELFKNHSGSKEEIVFSFLTKK